MHNYIAVGTFHYKLAPVGMFSLGVVRCIFAGDGVGKNSIRILVVTFQAVIQQETLSSTCSYV